MGKYIVNKPIYEADQLHARGSEIELADERAAQIGPEYVTPVVASEESPTSPAGSEEAPEASGEEADGSEEESEDEESSEEEGSNEE